MTFTRSHPVPNPFASGVPARRWSTPCAQAVSETNGHRGPEARASLLTDRSSSWQEEDNSETSGNSPTTPGHVRLSLIDPARFSEWRLQCSDARTPACRHLNISVLLDWSSSWHEDDNLETSGNSPTT